MGLYICPVPLTISVYWGDSKGRRVSFADEYLLTQKNKHSHTQWGKLGRYV